VTDWHPLETEDGSWTLVHGGHGEACHSRSGAWLEALERYARPCRLAETARRRPRPVRLLDVGTGPGWNLVAALHVLRGASALEVVTLEDDPAVIRAGIALLERDREPARAQETGAVARALTLALQRTGEAVPLAGGSLRLLLGDARVTLRSLPSGRDAAFDAVFLDPFSPARAPELWGHAFLAEVGRRLAPEGWLSTYSVSLGVRVGLVRAGLRVGSGPPVGAKREGTLASPAGSPPALEPRVQERLELAAGALEPSSAAPVAKDSRLQERDPSPGID
jgi:tRNA U34 5-methylaminomethyl-2-thiouridine-forming methyltransferase MnmC